MNLWTFLFLTVLIGVAGEAFRNWLKHRERLGDGKAGAGAGELDTLRRRVEALEAIVTDRGYDLKAEIDALDERARRAS